VDPHKRVRGSLPTGVDHQRARSPVFVAVPLRCRRQVADWIARSPTGSVEAAAQNSLSSPEHQRKAQIGRRPGGGTKRGEVFRQDLGPVAGARTARHTPAGTARIGKAVGKRGGWRFSRQRAPRPAPQGPTIGPRLAPRPVVERVDVSALEMRSGPVDPGQNVLRNA